VRIGNQNWGLQSPKPKLQIAGKGGHEKSGETDGRKLNGIRSLCENAKIGIRHDLRTKQSLRLGAFGIQTRGRSTKMG